MKPDIRIAAHVGLIDDYHSRDAGVAAVITAVCDIAQFSALKVIHDDLVVSACSLRLPDNFVVRDRVIARDSLGNQLRSAARVAYRHSVKIALLDPVDVAAGDGRRELVVCAGLVEEIRLARLRILHHDIDEPAVAAVKPDRMTAGIIRTALIGRVGINRAFLTGDHEIAHYL